MMRIFLLFALAQSSTLVTLPYGQIQGNLVAGIRIFEGIPYAQPSQRYTRSRYPPNSWNGIRKSNKPPQCVQGNVEGSEDCLYLNVYSPENAERLPVMVWIHGGGFLSGSGSSSSPVSLLNSAQKSVVYVSLNYRVGALGFLASRALEDQKALNLGLWDQRIALEFIKANIAAFGGDPDSITVFGESAGAKSVGLHLLSFNGTQDLFSRAILESAGSLAGSYHSASHPIHENFFTLLVSKTGCSASSNVVNCLRTASLNDIIKASWAASTQRMELFPVIDQEILLDSPTNLIEKGLFSKIPILIGSNTNEGSVFVNQRPMTSEADFESFLRLYFPLDLILQIKNLYPASSYASTFLRASAVYGDRAYICPVYSQARAYARIGLQVHKYRFNQIPASSLPQDVNYPVGVAHGSEVAFVYGDSTLKNGDYYISRKMMELWMKFAKGEFMEGNFPCMSCC